MEQNPDHNTEETEEEMGTDEHDGDDSNTSQTWIAQQATLA